MFSSPTVIVILCFTQLILIISDNYVLKLTWKTKLADTELLHPGEMVS